MFYHLIPTKQRCRRCGAVDEHETFTRKGISGIRCLLCGNEHIYAAMTLSTGSTGYTVSATTPMPEYTDF